MVLSFWIVFLFLTLHAHLFHNFIICNITQLLNKFRLFAIRKNPKYQLDFKTSIQELHWKWNMFLWENMLFRSWFRGAFTNYVTHNDPYNFPFRYNFPIKFFSQPSKFYKVPFWKKLKFTQRNLWMSSRGNTIFSCKYDTSYK